MAGHRSLTALTLVFASVAPVTVGTMLIWTQFGWAVNAYGAVLLLIAAILATATPYALGWLRSLVTLMVALTALRSIQEWLGDSIVLAVVLSLAAVAAICLLARFSLKFGTIRKPHDAKRRDERDNTWPYQYF